MRINTSGHKPTGKKYVVFFYSPPPPPHTHTPLQAMKADTAQTVNRAAAHIKMPRCVNIYIPHQSPSALIPPRAALGIHLWLTLIHMFVWGKLRGGVACHGSVALDFISRCSVCTFWRYANMHTRECRGMFERFKKIKKIKKRNSPRKLLVRKKNVGWYLPALNDFLYIYIFFFICLPAGLFAFRFV